MKVHGSVNGFDFVIVFGGQIFTCPCADAVSVKNSVIEDTINGVHICFSFVPCFFWSLGLGAEVGCCGINTEH